MALAWILFWWRRYKEYMNEKEANKAGKKRRNVDGFGNDARRKRNHLKLVFNFTDVEKISYSS